MSKSSKKRPFQNKPGEPTPTPNKQLSTSAIPSSTKPLVQATAVNSSSTTEVASDNFTLIRFDKKVKWFIGICVGLFLLLTLAKINYSSIGMWNQIIPDGSDLKRGVISGTPKQIRMDEWANATTFMLSQAHQGFPLENPAIGGAKSPLVNYIPVNHFITIFRPSYWGFYLFSAETGLAWHWNFVIFFSLIVMTLTFMMLTRNQFWLSVLGAFWFVFSPGFAWWSFFFLTSIYSGFGMMTCAAFIFLEKRPKVIILSSILFLWTFVQFCLTLYPPYQVPLGYLLLFLLIGFIWQYFNKINFLTNLSLKIISLAIVGIVMGTIFYLYFIDAKPTIDEMSNTVYPGKRSETGGTGFIANWFSEYYAGWLLSDQKFPRTWLNICELSHFITFTPVIAVCLLLYAIKDKRVKPLLIITLAYVLVLWVWIEIGFPSFLAKATLLDVSPTRRTQIPFGIANVVLTIIYLGYIRSNDTKVSAPVSLLLVLWALGVMIYAAWLNIDDAEGIYKSHQLFVPTVFFLALNYLLLPVSNFKGKEIVVAASLALFTLPNLKINPVTKGLTAITENALYQKVREIHLQDPKARWIVLGNQYITYLVTATGVNQLSGVKIQPDFKSMRVLDPTAKRDSAYNRYAHSVYNSYVDPAHPDSVIIQNTFEDGYQVALDPCSPKLRKLNVRYFLFDHVPQPVEVRCMKQLAKLGNLEIYRSND